MNELAVGLGHLRADGCVRAGIPRWNEPKCESAVEVSQVGGGGWRTGGSDDDDHGAEARYRILCVRNWFSGQCKNNLVRLKALWCNGLLIPSGSPVGRETEAQKKQTKKIR